MKLSKEAVEEFKSLYREEFGEELSDEEAYAEGVRLLRLLRIVVTSRRAHPSQSEL